MPLMNFTLGRLSSDTAPNSFSIRAVYLLGQVIQYGDGISFGDQFQRQVREHDKPAPPVISMFLFCILRISLDISGDLHF